MKENFQFLVYQSSEENISVNAMIKDDLMWLNQKETAFLFGVDVSSISRHLKNIFLEGELREEVVVAKNAITTLHNALKDVVQLAKIRQRRKKLRYLVKPNY